MPLSFENKPATYSVQANAPGYWPNSTSSPSAKEGDRPSVDQLIVRQCTARILGGRVLDVRQKPVVGASVGVHNTTKVTTSGADGTYRVDADVLLALNNTPGSATLDVRAPVERTELLRTSSNNVGVYQCGDVITYDIVIPDAPVIPPTVPNFGSITGTITDAESHLPVGGAAVSVVGGGSASTAADGTYRIDNVLVGYNSQTSSTATVSITRTGYWNETASVADPEGQDVDAGQGDHGAAHRHRRRRGPRPDHRCAAARGEGQRRLAAAGAQ